MKLAVIVILGIFCLVNSQDRMPGMKIRANRGAIEKGFLQFVRAIGSQSPNRFIRMGDRSTEISNSFLTSFFSINNVNARVVRFSESSQLRLSVEEQVVITEHELEEVVIDGRYLFNISTPSMVIEVQEGSFTAMLRSLQFRLHHQPYINDIGRNSVAVTMCSITNPFDLDMLDAEFQEEYGILYLGLLREQIKQNICDSMTALLTAIAAADQGNQNRFRNIRSIVNGVMLDLTAVQNTEITEDGMIAYLDGTPIPRNMPETRYDYSPGPLGEFSPSTEDWQVITNDYFSQGLAHSWYLLGSPNFDISPENAPAGLKGLLNTKIMSGIIPGFQQYGDRSMIMQIRQATPPIQSLGPGTFSDQRIMGMRMMVVMEDGEMDEAMSMEGDLLSVNTLSADDDVFVINIMNMTAQMSQTTFKVGRAPEQFMDAMENMLENELREYYNMRFRSGFSLPPLAGNAEIRNIKVQITPDKIELEGDQVF